MTTGRDDFHAGLGPVKDLTDEQLRDTLASARPADEVVGIAYGNDHYMVVTRRGLLYRVSKDDQDMVKLWVEIPV